MVIKKVTIYGERCSGTNYLENLLTINFDVYITFEYGWKHFFGFHALDDTALFVCIVRDPVDWMNSFYREMHHLPLKQAINITPEERKHRFLNNEFWSFYDNNGSTDMTNEIMEDRHIYTGKRYKNIFEARHIKNKFLIEDLPRRVKYYCLIKYEDLLVNFHETMNKLKDLNILELKSSALFPQNTQCYKNNPNLTFTASIKPERVFSRTEVIHHPEFNPEYEYVLGYICP